MRSYLFFNEGGLVPPPMEYARFTQARALWQELGWVRGEHAKEEEDSALVLIQVDREYRQQKKD